MTDISGVDRVWQANHASIVSGRSTVGRAAVPASTEAHPSYTDEVQLSDSARRLDQLTSTRPVRTELVERVKAEIESGTYETPERIERAVDGLAQDLGF